MPNNYVVNGATLGFKVGTQDKVNELIALGTRAGATHGTFYLAQDTHRLYIGNEDTSLSPVNEGITTVASINDLPTPTTAAANKGTIGQFYYVTGSGDAADQNILCVYNGRGWVQINTNTNDYITSFTYTVDTDSNSESLLRSTVTDTGNHGAVGRFKIKGKNGVTTSYSTASVTVGGVAQTVPLIEVSADYSIGVTKNNSTGDVSIQLTGEGGNNSSFKVVAGADSQGAINSSIDKDGNNLSIITKDTKISEMKFDSNSTSGFDLKITDNYYGTKTATVNPQITYGAGTPSTATFKNGTANLSIYSKDEIDDLLKRLNAMTYIGTYNISGQNATAVDSFQITQSPKSITASLNGNPVKFHIGDTILVAVDPSFSFNGVEVYKGSLMIAKGTEGSDGYITASTLTFDIVAASHDTDTTYRFEQATNGIYLMPNNGSQAHGGLIFTGGNDTGTVTDDLIKVTKTYASAASGTGKIATIKVEHKDVARTNTTGTAVSQGAASKTYSYDRSTVVNVITGITTNSSGHITGVQTTEVTLHDTNMYITAFNTTIDDASVYTNSTTNKNVGILKTTITEKNPALDENVVTSYNGITSKSLKISKDNPAISTSNSQQVAALNIEMVWGSF